MIVGHFSPPPFPTPRFLTPPLGSFRLAIFVVNMAAGLQAPLRRPGLHGLPRAGRRPGGAFWPRVRLLVEVLALLALCLYAWSVLQLVRSPSSSLSAATGRRGRHSPSRTRKEAVSPEGELAAPTKPPPRPRKKEVAARRRAPSGGSREQCTWVPTPPFVRFSGTSARGYDRDVIVRTKPGAHSAVASVDRRWITRGVTKYSHMVTLAVDGSDDAGRTVYAAWQASDKHEGASDQHIRLARSRDGGVKWSRSWIVATGEEYPIWGPVLHSDGPKLWLFYSASTHNCTVPNRDDWRSPGGDIMAITSEDGAKTWSVPRTLLRAREVNEDARPRGHAPAPLVTANSIAATESNGGDSTWLLPFWSESRRQCGGGNGDPMDEAHALISRDRGETWRMSGEGVAAPLTSNATWLIENTIAPLQGGARLAQLFRTKAGFIYASWSRDDGDSWSEAEALGELPNPDSKVHALRLPGASSDVVVAYNHNSVAGRRTPLYLARGSGARHGHWQTPVAVLEDDRYTDFSYPTSVARLYEMASASSGDSRAASLPGLVEVLTAYTVAPSDGHVPTSYRGLRVASTVLGAPLIRAIRGKVAVRNGLLRIPLGTGACASLASPGVPIAAPGARAKAFQIRISVRAGMTRQFLEACADAEPRGELRLLELRGLQRVDEGADVSTDGAGAAAANASAAAEDRMQSLAAVSMVCVRGGAQEIAALEEAASKSEDSAEPAWEDPPPASPKIITGDINLSLHLRGVDGRRLDDTGTPMRITAMMEPDQEHVLAVSVYPLPEPGRFTWTLHKDSRFVGRASWNGNAVSEARLGCARGPGGLSKLNLGESAIEVRELEVSEIVRYNAARCASLAEQMDDVEPLLESSSTAGRPTPV